MHDISEPGGKLHLTTRHGAFFSFPWPLGDTSGRDIPTSYYSIARPDPSVAPSPKYATWPMRSTPPVPYSVKCLILPGPVFFVLSETGPLRPNLRSTCGGMAPGSGP